MKIILTQEYKQNLQNIIRYIKQDKPSVIVGFREGLKQYISLLQTNPQMGQRVKKDIRRLVYRGYTIFYKVENDIFILDIFKYQNKQN